MRKSKAYLVLEYLGAVDKNSGATLKAVYNCQAPVFKDNPAVEPIYRYTSFSGGLTLQTKVKRPKIARYKENGRWRYYICRS